MALTKVRLKPLFGSSVSFSNRRTKRRFGINYKKVKLWSFVLKRFVKLKVSVKLLKTIKRYGGIDFYVINFKRLPKQFVKIKSALLALMLK